MLGHGKVDYSRVFRALDQMKFTEPVVVECSTFMKFEEACDSSFTAMVAAAGKADVKFTKTS